MTETPIAEDFEEAGRVTVMSRRQSKRGNNMPEAVAYTAKIMRVTVIHRMHLCPTWMSIVIDLDGQYGLVMAGIGSDALAKLACAASLFKNNTDAHEWAKKLTFEFDCIKMTDPLRDLVPLSMNVRCIGTMWVFKEDRNLESHYERF